MVRRFERDDAGYLAWLKAHPDGYVLNTYMHVTSDYLVLHRAACRTVNRELGPNRTWTFAYGKTCSDDRAELEAWALEVGGRPAQPCGHCMGPGEMPGRDRPPAGLHVGLGPRAPRAAAAIQMNGRGVTICIEPMPDGTRDAPPLVIEGAQWLAETFFRQDPSAVGPGSFDAWIAATQADPERRDRIVDEDVTAVNTTMAARTSHDTWAHVIDAGDWDWLLRLDPAWDLVRMNDDEWKACAVPDRLRDAFSAVQRPGLQVAVVTKVLHIKRPALIPVLDSLVLGQIAARVSSDVRTWVAAIEHLRRVGRTNRDGLDEIAAHLIECGIAERPPLRILDSLLWTSMPGSILFGRLGQWERVIRPRQAPCGGDAPR